MIMIKVMDKIIEKYIVKINKGNNKAVIINSR